MATNYPENDSLLVRELINTILKVTLQRQYSIDLYKKYIWKL